MKNLMIAIAFSVCATAQLAAQRQSQNPVCAAAEKVSIPAADLPPVPTDLDKCDPLELQSRPSHPVDLRAVRYCAYTARDVKSTEQDDKDMDHIGGNAGLAMIYAGGKGVAPNVPLAERFACDIKGGWDDGTEVAEMLEAKRKEGKNSIDFDICENPSGRQLNYLCLLRNQNRVADEVALAEKRFNTGSPQQRSAFQRLLVARKAYLDARDTEEPRGSPGIAQNDMQDEIDIDREWVQTLGEFADGKVPDYTVAEFRHADAALNQSYHWALQDTAKCSDEFCLKPEELRHTERLWITYREQWVAYAALRWPSISADSWRMWLTLERIENLARIQPN
jgi:hypothetical protein